MHYLMERHREILLESYLVHRSDVNGDGVLDIEERQVLLTEIETALKQKVARQSLQEQILAMNIAGLPLPKVSKPLWSSADGYPFGLKTPANPTSYERIKDPTPPMFTVDDRPHDRTPQFDFVDMCLTNDFVHPGLADVAVDTQLLFQLLAKEYPYCGDTLLAILIPSSPSGFHHLLPAPSHPKYSEITHQLHKYAYTISQTSSEFIMAQNAGTLKSGFTRTLRTLKYKGLAQFCVNDDVEYGDGLVVQKMDSVLKGFLQGYFGGLTTSGGKGPVEKAESVQPMDEAGRQFWRSALVKGGPGYER
jgi:hypothetical protein